MKIGILAGEASGDLLGAGLMRAIALEENDVRFSGIGGPRMKTAGLYELADFELLAINGFKDPLLKSPRLLYLLRQLESYFLEWQPDVFVGIDFNVFNLMLEKRLKRAGLKTVHYVSPSVYAWRRGRIKGIQRSADRILTLFPFEAPLYTEQGMDAVFVGHPLADKMELVSSASDKGEHARLVLNIDKNAQVVALMPGSRFSELKLMGTCFLEAAGRIVQSSEMETVFVLPCQPGKLQAWIQAALVNFPGLDVRLIMNNTELALAACDVALVKSGTSTLEAMMLGKPMVVCYKLGRISYAVVKKLMYGDFVALPNILANRQLVPEILQGDASPENLSAEVLELLEQVRERDSRVLELQGVFLNLHRELKRDANRRAASAVLEIAGVR